MKELGLEWFGKATYYDNSSRSVFFKQHLAEYIMPIENYRERRPCGMNSIKGLTGTEDDNIAKRKAYSIREVLKIQAFILKRQQVNVCFI